MIGLLVTLLQQEGIEEIKTFRWLALPELWVIGLVLLPAIVVFSTLIYRGQADLPPRTRFTLGILRGLAVLLVLLAIFRPAWETTRYANVRRQVHVLVDDSASMGRRDVYLDEGARAALEAIRSARVEPLEKLTRSELVRDVLGRKGGIVDELRKDYDVQFYRFSRKPLAIKDLTELRAQDAYTRIGDALDLHLSEYSGDLLDSVILVSDGRNNEGISPEEAARKYRGADVRVHTVGVGDPTAPHNIAIVGPLGPKEGLAKEELRFEFSITAQGYAGKEAPVLLRGRREGGALETLETRTIRLGGDGEPMKVEIRHVFEEPGDYTLTFEVPPFPDETNRDDNTDTRYLRVDAQKIRVLYLEGRPRWEYRYLKNALRRVDRSIQGQCFLFSATRRFPQEASPGLPSLTDIPRTRQELFQYHVVILGDVTPEMIGNNNDEETARWLKLLAEFVEFGGGVAFQAGEWAMPERYRGTPVVDLLPVILSDSGENDAVALDRVNPFVPVLEDFNRPHEIVQFEQDLGVNRVLWQDKLQGFLWYFPVRQPKAGSEVVIRHPEHTNKYGRRVICALGYYPRGRTAWVGTDETWRWRKPFGEKYQDRFWRNLIRWLAEERLKRLNDRVDLVVDRKVAEFGQQIRVTVRVKDADYNPKVASEETIHVRTSSGQTDKRSLRKSAAEPGTFEGSFSFSEPGIVSFLFYTDGDPKAPLLAREDVLVRAPDREMNLSSLDEGLLRAVASAAGGRYVALAEVDELGSEFRKKGQGRRERDRRTSEVWDSWVTLLGVVSLLTAEWILRKRARLV